MEQQPILNEHNKQEYPPMHTAEHILNQTMVRMFGCQRSRNAHIERKKSKCDYRLPQQPTPEQVAELERRVNEVIAQNLPVTYDFVPRNEVPPEVDLGKLPDDASSTLRLVRIGDYDLCACVGTHVANTSEIGTFRIISHDFTPAPEGENLGTWRLRFKLELVVSGQ
jgi:alanyl-tRNA synthetase